MGNAPVFEFFVLMIAVGAIALVYWFSRKQNVAPVQKSTYLEALEHLVDGNDRLSIEKLKETVRNDTENVEAYLRLGDVLRKRGLHSNAARIHKDLTLRGGLTADFRAKIYKSLFNDYLAQQDFKNAVEAAEKVLEFDNTPDAHFLQQYLQSLATMNQWQPALDLIQRFRDSFPDSIEEKAALFLVFLGIELQEQNLGKDARVRFKEALKKDSGCSAAHYYLGKSYIFEDRLEDAAKIWSKFCQQFPRKSYFVFSELEKVWFDLDRFLDAERMYQELFNNDRSNIHAGLALARIHSKKGEFEISMEIIQQLEEKHPDSLEILRHKIEHFFQKGQYKQAATQAMSYFETVHGTLTPVYHCQECQYSTETPQWICPKCKSINSFGLS
ncbi:MAG: tetratricopeptide repeat protein [Calditrichaeota bacterium]|nr:tetratricopeptide repeat protein [Calditrichota bacterium]MCB0267418.1 tetratricopeptide repeat protein [Calditrichota bacterium]